MERMLRGAYKNYLYNHTCEDAAQTYMIARQNTPVCTFWLSLQAC